MKCETCGDWPPAGGEITQSGTHNRLCPFAPIPVGYGAKAHRVHFSHPGDEYLKTFDGVTPVPAGDRVAGHKNPNPAAPGMEGN